MVTHVVLFKLKDRSQESIQKAKDVLLGLQGRIPELRGFEVGADGLHSERSYDIALIAKFDDMAGLNAYQRHPEHVNAAEYMRQVREAAVAVDYETP